MEQNKLIISTSIFLFLLVFTFLPLKTSASSFYLSPQEGHYKIRDTFSVDVMINSDENYINAAQATIYFAPERLKVLDISKENSIFALWPQEPIFSNEKGEISFLGGLPSPGFLGKEGKVVTLLFQAKSSDRQKYISVKKKFS